MVDLTNQKDAVSDRELGSRKISTNVKLGLEEAVGEKPTFMRLEETHTYQRINSVGVDSEKQREFEQELL